MFLPLFDSVWLFIFWIYLTGKLWKPLTIQEIGGLHMMKPENSLLMQRKKQG
jgi:hypothetical protein